MRHPMSGALRGLMLTLMLMLGPTGCAREAPHAATDTEVRRLMLAFSQPRPSDPPATLTLRVGTDDSIVLRLERSLSGGYGRYVTPPLSSPELQALLQTLNGRDDIAHAEADTRRGVR